MPLSPSPPVVEIAHEDSPHFRFSFGNLRQAPELRTAFRRVQAEMRGNHPKRTGRQADHRLHGSSRLPSLNRNIVDLRIAQRSPADQHLPVMAIGGRDRFPVDRMTADRFPEIRERIQPAMPPVPRIDLLKREYVRRERTDHPGSALRIEFAVGADTAMDVPGHQTKPQRVIPGHCRTSSSATRRTGSRRTGRATGRPDRPAGRFPWRWGSIAPSRNGGREG